MLVEKMRQTAQELMGALDTNELGAIQAAQQQFSLAVEEAWQAYQQGKIQAAGLGEALPRSMYLYATRELPQEVAFWRRWSTVKREITSFLRMIDLVVGSSAKR